MATKFVVVTGTDTGVGKTFVTSALARSLADRGVNVRAVKPIESGATGAPDEDGRLLAVAARQSWPTEALVRLKASLAPPIAAELEDVTLDWDAIISEVRGIEADLVLVEAVGGLLSPLTATKSSVDLAHALNAEVLVVSVDRLGTLNHTLMTLRTLSAERQQCAGVIMCSPQTPDESTGKNAPLIARLSHIDRVTSLPWLSTYDEAAGYFAGWYA